MKKTPRSMFCGYFVHIEDDTFIDVRYWCECNIRKPPNQTYDSHPKKVIPSDLGGAGWFRPVAGRRKLSS